MGTIRVEAVPVQSYNLGLFRFDHLQLVYQDETDFIDSQDYWFVIEGIQDGALFAATLGASGENGRLSLGVANGGSRDDLIAKIGTPETRGSRIISSGPNVLALWDKMASYAGQIDAQKYPYIGLSWPFGPTPTINSTSLIASVLWSVGIDLNTLMPFNIRLSPGPETILGTALPDDMTAAGNYTTVATGFGNDTLHGSVNSLWWEKFYGGLGSDTIQWSYGTNIMHGGQPRMPYLADGKDTIDYSGIGAVHIEASLHAIDHKVSEYVATFDGGMDQWFSIESIRWDAASDTVTAGPGVRILEKAVELDLKGSSGGRGDQLSMADGNAELLVNVVSGNLISVQAKENDGLDAGYWVSSVEWFIGSTAGDKIYAGSTLLGVEGHDGDDTLDARLVAAFTSQSPLGYDIELYGGRGDDTIVSGEGRTFASGGSGDDIFVLSAMTSGNGTVEFVIDDAEAGDKLYIPYDMFKLSRGGYEGSTLFQVTGGVFKIDDVINPAYFEWGVPDDDQVQGNIEFVGQISYEMSGSDLVIKILQGHSEQVTEDYGPGEPPGPTYTLSVGELDTETIVRVRNWSEGILGLTFPVTWDNEVFAGTQNGLEDYPGYQTAINTATAPDKFIAALEERPESHLPRELIDGTGVSAAGDTLPVTDGTDGNDTLSVTIGGPYWINGHGGNDTITGSDGGDLIDGGTGNDTMDGGRGNDGYVVDAIGDSVIERDRGGFDHVYASIDYTLGAFLEHLTLEGAAINGTGNTLRNRISGNERDNALAGGGGDDTLAGNGGDDTLAGGIGSDAYVYEIGDGHDTILESAAESADTDLIIFAGELTGSDISFIRNPDHMLDLVLRLSDGGSITVRDYFAPGGHTIESIEFTSGSTWTAEEVAARAAAASLTRNTAPVAEDDVFAFSGGISVTIPVAALLDNDRDADGHTLTVTALSNITGGTAVLDGQGNVVITRTGASGTNVSFDYTISDGNGGTAHANFDVAMNANSAPIITSGTLATVVANTAAAGRLIATDADGDTLIYAVKAGAGPEKGTIAFQDDGHFTYTPGAGVSGTDTFTLTVSDGFSAPAEQLFTVTLPSTNTAPIARADSGYTLHAGQALTLSSAQLLANDTDADGHALAITGVTAVAGGSVALTAGGVTFTALPGYVGPASFSYAISDGHGGTSSALVNLTIENTAPIARADSGYTLHAGQALTLSSAQLLANDTDADGHALAITGVTAVAGGSVALTAGGVTFTALPGHVGPASFSYAISDGHGGTSSALVNLTIENTAPIARADSGYTLHAGQALTLSSAQLLANDTDADGHALAITGVSNVRGGTVRTLTDGRIYFHAEDDASGVASFNYTVSDGRGGTGTASVAIRLLAGPDGVRDSAPNNIITGTVGRDVLSGTAAAEIFIGLAERDTFVFHTGQGHDQINDFETGDDLRGAIDVLDLRGSGLTGYLDLLSHIHAQGADTLITLDAGSSILLKDVAADTLMFDNFRIL